MQHTHERLAPSLTADSVPQVTELLNHPGPYASAYIGLEPETVDAAARSDLRWDALRTELGRAEAAPSALQPIDALVPDAHMHGRALGVIVAADGHALVHHEPSHLDRDCASYERLPMLGPLLAWYQSRVPHIVVRIDRAGADVSLLDPAHREPQHETIEVFDSNDPVLRRGNPGGWSQPRYQRRAINSWEASAKEVAEHVTSLARVSAPRTIVLAGDGRAAAEFRDALPDDLRALLVDAPGTRHGGNTEALEEAIDTAVATAVARDTAHVLAKFREEVGQHDLAVNGATPTLHALAAAQVDVLLVHLDPDDPRRAWFGTKPHLVGRSLDELYGMGVERPYDAPLTDVAIWAALGTGASVRIVPKADLLEEGIGALLRFTH